MGIEKEIEWRAGRAQQKHFLKKNFFSGKIKTFFFTEDSLIQKVTLFRQKEEQKGNGTAGKIEGTPSSSEEEQPKGRVSVAGEEKKFFGLTALSNQE